MATIALFDNEETQAICESASNDKVVKFVKKNSFPDEIQQAMYNGDIWGVYYDESGNLVAQDNQGDVYPIREL